MRKTLLLLLIIYIGFSSETWCQNLQLKVSGNDSLETATIDSIGYTKIHRDFSSMEKELDTLYYTINSLGYIESNRHPLTKVNDSLFLTTIELNKRFGTIKIYYDKSLVSKAILNQVSENVTEEAFILDFRNIESALEFINLKTSEKGFPFAELKLDNIIKNDDNSLEANLIIANTNQSRSINKIIVRGYDKFPKSYLKHYLKIKTGNVLNLTEIKNKTQQLNDLPFANQIKEPEILFSKDSTILYLYIEKNKSNAFDGFLGFGTNENTNKLEFNGYLDLQLVNNLNFGESFTLKYKSDENDLRTFDVKLFLPYLFQTPLGLEGELNLFKKDSSFTTSYQKLKSHYQINPKNRIAIGLKAIQSNNLLNQENNNPLIQDYKTTFYNVRYEFLYRQNQSRLFRNNALIDLELGTGNRKLESSKTSQFEYSLEAFKIFNLNKRNSAYIRLKNISLFSDDYLENELIRFGGINSIRGFEENSLSATFYALLNTEYRYLLSSNFYLHSIIDVAYFENDIINQKEKLYSIGFGFGILTNAGLLRFNYANGKSENQNFKLSNSQIHISLSAIF
ncbi:POTRA domain-containing protein [Hanstruepera flava]|uniref:POTRA domain-containing protein n=1 Tax=Hanstruepera flava TaxID=2930218 RepID=UPI002027B8E9|nr:POTRA domain-containing protein [Hanstruepera flava]